MMRNRSRVWIAAATVVLLGYVGYANSDLMEGESEPLPPDDEVVRYSVKTRDNPGRVEFSHVRHFNASGDKKCKTCHTAEIGLRTSPTYASKTPNPSLESHAPKSVGRYCATCHNGVTRLSQVGTLGGLKDKPIFTAFKSGESKRCQLCHAPADHGLDFTAAHEDVAERLGRKACLSCHAQDWEQRDRQAHELLITAEQTLKANPDDPKAALVVGPNNFCVYCHWNDKKWLEEPKGRSGPKYYAEAVKQYRQAAEQGDAHAQTNLGFMYDNGRGVPQNYGEAVKWYRKAAEQGEAVAQYNLGVMYEKGKGVPQDLVLAHMWFNLVAAQGLGVGQKDRDIVAKRMTADQIAQAQKLAQEWKSKLSSHGE